MFNISKTVSSGMFQCSYFTEHAHIGMIVLYIIATLINFCGNSLIWRAVIKNKSLQTPVNYLLLNLCLADIVSGMSIYPYLFIVDVGEISKSPRKQPRLCMIAEGLVFFFLPSISGVSLFTLCGISYNRFLAVKYPFRPNWRANRKSAIIFNVLAWIICTVVMVPQMLTFKYESKLKTCTREWSQINGMAYRLSLLLAIVIIPTVFLCMSFLPIILLRRKNRQLHDNLRSNTDGKLKKVEKMIGILILVCAVCWLPFNLYMTIEKCLTIFQQLWRDHYFLLYVEWNH